MARSTVNNTFIGQTARTLAIVSIVLATATIFLSTALPAQEGAPKAEVERSKTSEPQQGYWFSKEGGELQRRLDTLDNGGASADFSDASSAAIYFERNRKNFRPDKGEFDKSELSFNLRVECKGDEAVPCCIFLKNKDGLWYQSRKIFQIQPHADKIISVKLASAAMEMQPEGHESAWNCLDRTTTLTRGICIFDPLKRPLKATIGPPLLSGKRSIPELFLSCLEFPQSVKQNCVAEGSFEISREYFNPFDPDEIKADVQIVHPDFKETIRPAFFTRDYRSTLRINR